MRLPDEHLSVLREIAEEQNRTLNNLIETLLMESAEKRDAVLSLAQQIADLDKLEGEMKSKGYKLDGLKVVPIDDADE